MCFPDPWPSSWCAPVHLAMPWGMCGKPGWVSAVVYPLGYTFLSVSSTEECALLLGCRLILFPEDTFRDALIHVSAAFLSLFKTP